MTIMCELLGIDEAALRAWLCNKRIKTVHEVVNTPLSLSQVGNRPQTMSNIRSLLIRIDSIHISGIVRS